MADLNDLNYVWDKDINKHSYEKEKWIRWKDEFINNYKNGIIKTFVAEVNGDIIAQITVATSPLAISDVNVRDLLCDQSMAYMMAFRCDKEYEGKGHISKLVKLGEQYAKENGFQYTTIGSEVKESRNLAIYLHFGYTEYIAHSFCENELEVFYKKKL
jgi:GNAT superfamily N-acetyltransferase